MRKIRILLALLVVLALSVNLAACSGAPASEAPAETPAADTAEDAPAEEAPAEGTEIRYFTWTQEQEAGMSASIEAFEAQSANGVTVDMQISPWDQYWQKMQTEIAGGNAADVFMNQTWYFTTLQESGAAAPLNDWIERDGVSLEAHNQNVVNIYTDQNDGLLYAMPQDWDAICIIYNKDMFDEYGLPYPDDTLEWNPTDGGSFVELAQQLTVDTNGNNATSADFDSANVDTYGFMVQNNSNTFYWNFMKMNGSEILDYGSPEAIETVSFFQDLMYKYNVAPQIASVQSMGPDEMFATGNIGMYTNGNWALTTLENTCDFDWQVAVLPKGPEGLSTLVNGIGQSVYAKGDNQEAAWEFVKWLGGEQSQEILATTGTVFPSTNTYWDDYIAYWTEKGVDISPYQTMFDTAETYTAPLVPNWNEKTASVTKNFDLAFTNRSTAEEAAAAIVADFEALGE